VWLTAFAYLFPLWLSPVPISCTTQPPRWPARLTDGLNVVAKIAAQLAGHNPNKAATPEAYVAGAREVGDPE